MALSIKDRIYQETSTEGTGTLTLTNVKEGYQGFVALPNGSDTYYCITNDDNWEVGQGQYINTGVDTLARTFISSSTGALLDLKGASSVFCTYPAEKGVILNLDGNIQLPKVNARLKNITGDQVTSPVVVTEAVVVDGTAGSAGDLASLLDVYTKDEIKDIEEAQNKEIAETYLSKKDGAETYLSKSDGAETYLSKKDGGTITGNVIINRPRRDVNQNSFEIKGRVDGVDNTVLLKDYQYAIDSEEVTDAIQYFGGQIGERSIMNKGQIRDLVDGEIDEAVKEFKERHTLSNNTNTMKHVNATKALSSLEFGTSNATISAGNSYYLNQLYDNENNPVSVKDYKPTSNSMFEIWLGDKLQLRTTVKFWQESTVNANQRKFNPSGNAPSIAVSGSFDDSARYTVILTNVEKV